MLKGRFTPPLLALIAGMAMLPFPLLRDLHVESASVATAAGTILAAWRFTRPQDPLGSSPWLELVLTGAAFVLPLIVRALFASCVTLDGALFWAIYPTSGLLFGAAVGAFFRSWSFRRPMVPACLLLLCIALGVWLIEFFTLPQVRFFNHVWGHFPGPVYDEEASFTYASIHFRFVTLLWAAILWLLTKRPLQDWAKWMLMASVPLLLTAYMQMPRQGVVSPRGYIQQVLGGSYTSEHFTLYYDKRAFSDVDIQKWARLHEYYRSHILEVLELDPSSNMLHTESYLYRHVWQKRELTGAKHTSYVPVWNNIDQTHIAKEALDGTLHHELVHVAAKAFGNRVINASWSFGLIEGLAVAVVPDVSDRSTIDQIVAASPNRPDAQTVAASFSPTGFYTGRGGVNYTTSGSFVRWLMRNYPASDIKEAYRTGSFRHYGVPFETMVDGWNAALDSIPVDTTDRRVNEEVFGRISLFERECPRRVTPMYRALDLSRKHLLEGDTLKAAEHASSAWALKPEITQLWVESARLWLMANKPEQVLTMDADSVDMLPIKRIYRADALYMMGDTLGALGVLATLTDDRRSPTLQRSVERRLDLDRWKQWLNVQYRSDMEWPSLRQAPLEVIQAIMSSGSTIGRVPIPERVHEWIPVMELDFSTLEAVTLQLYLLDRTSEAQWVLERMPRQKLRDREWERLELLRELVTPIP